MAKTLQEELIVKISADVSDLSKKIDQANSKVGGFASSAKKLGGIMAGAFAVSKVAEFGKAIIMGASDMEESLNKVNVVFGNSSQQVIDFANNSLTAFGIAKGEALEATSLFGDMATSMGLNNQEASEMAMSMTALSGDLASFKNIRTDVAQTALKGIFTGETESLKSLGIVMTEANLEQFAMEQGIQKNIKSMTQAEKVNLRYAFVMDKTKTAQGDFAKTSDGSANQMRIFQQSMAELGAELGAIVLPLFNKLIKFVNRLVAQVRKGLPKVKQVFSNTFRAIQNAVISYIQFFVKNNPFNLLIQGVNAVARTFNLAEIGNPFEKLMDGLEGLKATIPEVTEEVQSSSNALQENTTQSKANTQSIKLSQKEIKKLAEERKKLANAPMPSFTIDKESEDDLIDYMKRVSSLVKQRSEQIVEDAEIELGDMLPELDMEVEDTGEAFEFLTEDGVSVFAERAEKMKEISKQLSESVGDLFNQMANSLVSSLNLADDGFQGFVKNLIPTITKLITMMLAQSQAQSIAGATSSGTATGPAAVVTTPAFIATALAGVISAFATIPKFALGGIVGGTSFQGDNILARVNSGEMILNKAQQGRLFAMINNPNMGSSVGFGGRLRGEDIFFSQERSTNRLSRYR